MAQPTPPSDTRDDPSSGHRPEESVSRRAVVAGSIGNFVEWYDFVLYGASAPILARVLFANTTRGRPAGHLRHLRRRVVARPFGAFILGNLGDRAGRRNEFGGSATFIVEYAPPGRRGRYGSWQTTTVGLGSATATATVLLFSAVLSQEQLDSWGWRIPFVIALPLGLIGLYLRLKLNRSRTASPASHLGDLPVRRGHSTIPFTNPSCLTPRVRSTDGAGRLPRPLLDRCCSPRPHPLSVACGGEAAVHGHVGDCHAKRHRRRPIGGSRLNDLERVGVGRARAMRVSTAGRLRLVVKPVCAVPQVDLQYVQHAVEGLR
jgi:hypothetical protein